MEKFSYTFLVLCSIICGYLLISLCLDNVYDMEIWQTTLVLSIFGIFVFSYNIHLLKQQKKWNL